MTTHSINIGDQAKVKSGRYAGRLVQVLELKDDNSSAKCRFVPSGLTPDEVKSQESGTDFESTWFGLDILEPVMGGRTSDIGERQT